MKNFYISIICIKSFDISLERLLPTIPSHFKKIIIYQKEDDYSYKIKENGDIFVNVKNNIFEYGHWIGLKYLFDKNLLNNNDKFLLLHSTMIFLDDPTFRIHKLLLEMGNNNIYFVTSNGQYNICLIDKIGIDTGYEYYRHFITMDKDTAIAFEWQHNLKWSPKSWPINKKFHQYDAYFVSEKPIYTDLIRKITFIPSLYTEKYHGRKSEEAHLV
jgi:hypothetical protein